MLHPLSVINSKAVIGRHTSVGPYAIISEFAEIGDDCEIGPYVVIGPDVRIGKRCRISTGVVIGKEPQDRSYQGEPSSCIIGDDNTIREYTTITRASGVGARTEIGNANYIMTYVHVAHNAKVGNNVVITSGSQLGGYVEIGDNTTIGGLVGVHQHCRVGRLAMVGALSYINKDFPPFFIGRGNPCRIRGVNSEGLRRLGLSDAYSRLKSVYRTIYRSTLSLSRAIDQLKHEYPDEEDVQYMVRFIKSSKRGLLLKA